MWRDRTNLYISYRQSYTHHPTKRPRYNPPSNGYADATSSDTQGLLAQGAYDADDAVIEMDLLPPRYLDVQEEVSSILETITKQSAQLDKLHSKHILPGFDDEEIKSREEIEIERLTQDITRGFQECQKAIKRIERMVKESRETGGLNSSDETMSKNIQVALAARVQEVSATFRKKQSTYLNKLRALSGFESPALGPGRSGTPLQGFGGGAQNPYTDPALADSESDKRFSQTTLQQTAQHQHQLQQRRQTNDAAIALREQEINDIAKGIIELSDIFRDLQTMVIDQGTMLDRIDYNVERMTTDVKGAEKELKVATGYQKRTTRRKVILLLILLVVGMFVLVLVKPRRSGNAAASNSPPASVQPPGVIRIRRISK